MSVNLQDQDLEYIASLVGRGSLGATSSQREEGVALRLAAGPAHT